MNVTKTIFLSVFVCTLLASCGGGDSQMSSSTPGSTTANASAPVILSFNPNPAKQGDTVKIIGSGFDPQAQVFAGGILSGQGPFNATFVSPTEIDFVPAFPQGGAPVQVVNPGNKISNTAFLSFEVPLTAICNNSGGNPDIIRVSSASPIKGTCSGPFLQGVTFFVGTQPAPVTFFQGPTHIIPIPYAEFSVPPQPAGLYDLKIVNPDGQTLTLPNEVQYFDPPTITSITPDTGTFAGSTTVTIIGTHFDIQEPFIYVQFETHVGFNGCRTNLLIDSISATQIVGRTPFQGTCGPAIADVTVTTPGGTSNVVPYTFTP